MVSTRVRGMLKAELRHRVSLCSPNSDDEEVDRLDADERHDHTADAVDQQVVAQHGRGTERLVATPRIASGISATMTSALKMTAESIADCGVARRMMLSASSCG